MPIAIELAQRAEGAGDFAEAERLYTLALEGLRSGDDPLQERWFAAHRARARMGLGRWAEGLGELEEILAAPGDLPPTFCSRCRLASALAAARLARLPDAEQHAGQALAETPGARRLPAALAHGFLAVARRDRPGGSERLAEARTLADEPGDDAVRALARAAIRDLEGDLAAWWISPDGARLDAPDGAVIELLPSSAHARLVLRLATGGAPMDSAVLGRAGWPGQRVLHAAMANRVRVALCVLRRRGLAGVIEREATGWWIRPERVRIVGE